MNVDDREIEELLDFGGARPRIATGDCELILAALKGVEARLALEGWDRPPQMFLIHGGRGPFGVMDQVAMRALAIPAERWDPDPGATLAEVAELVEAAPDATDVLTTGIPADEVLLGVAFAAEGWVRRADDTVPTRSLDEHPELRADEVRTLTGVDLDGRLYSVVRSRSSGHQNACVRTPQARAREVATSTDPRVRWLRRTQPDGVPPVERSLRRIALALASGHSEDRAGGIC